MAYPVLDKPPSTDPFSRVQFTELDFTMFMLLAVRSFPRLYKWFSRYVIAAMLVVENNRLLITLLLFVHRQLYIATLLSVSLEIGCKPPITTGNPLRIEQEQSRGREHKFAFFFVSCTKEVAN